MYLIGSRGCCHLKSSKESDWDIVLERDDEELSVSVDNCSGMNTLEICDYYHFKVKTAMAEKVVAMIIGEYSR